MAEDRPEGGDRHSADPPPAGAHAGQLRGAHGRGGLAKFPFLKAQYNTETPYFLATAKL